MEPDTKAKIIQAVKELYRNYDYETITTALIIETVGISKGTLYWHFKSKEDIFNYIYTESGKAVNAAAREGLDPEAPALEQLKRRQYNVLRFAHFYRLEQNFLRKYTNYLKRSRLPDPYPYIQNIDDEVRVILARGLERGELADFPLDFMVGYARMKSALLDLYIEAHPELWERPELLDAIIDRLLDFFRKQL